jgi:hypothetical protein
MCFLVLVHPNRTLTYADLKASHLVLDQRRCRPTHIPCLVPMGSHRDKGVSNYLAAMTFGTGSYAWFNANDTCSGGPLIRGKLEIQSDYMNTAYSALTGLNVIIGLFSSMAVNMPDFGRFSKNKLAGPHQFLALPIIGTLGALTPIFVTDAHSYLWGEFEW